ncbi:hypothetical protein GCM10011445_01390 [Pseudocitrobacter faecalis]|nr:hypothetical protein GCM10011445_01390 [Pseudocitrobacter faecalis]
MRSHSRFISHNLIRSRSLLPHLSRCSPPRRSLNRLLRHSLLRQNLRSRNHNLRQPRYSSQSLNRLKKHPRNLSVKRPLL